MKREIEKLSSLTLDEVREVTWSWGEGAVWKAKTVSSLRVTQPALTVAKLVKKVLQVSAKVYTSSQASTVPIGKTQEHFS